jgi:hypothetical protein
MSRSRIPAALRAEVVTQSPPWCAYCQNQPQVSGIRLTFDHIIPESSGGETVLINLCLACWDCNLLKQDRISAVDPLTHTEVPFYHPRLDRWVDHFYWNEDATLIIGRTPVGRAMIIALQLNRSPLPEARQRWVAFGIHPPHLT